MAGNKNLLCLYYYSTILARGKSRVRELSTVWFTEYLGQTVWTDVLLSCFHRSVTLFTLWEVYDVTSLTYLKETSEQVRKAKNLTSHHIQITVTPSEAGAPAQSHEGSVINIFSKTHNLSWYLINNMFYQTKNTAGKCPDIAAKIFTSQAWKCPENNSGFVFFPVLKLVHSYFTCLKRANLLCCEAPEKDWQTV